MKLIQTRKRLAELYRVDRETITRWLKRYCAIDHSYSLTPLELELFLNKVGSPEKLAQLNEQLTRR